MAGRRSTNVKRDLALGTADGSMYCVMVGCGESYLVPFALALGYSQGVAGLMGPLPQFVGALGCLALPPLLLRIRSVRTLASGLAGIQALTFLPLIAIALFSLRVEPWLLVLIASAYWFCALGAGVVWNAWVTDIYPKAIRAKYFGRRQRLQQIATVAGLTAAGFALDHGKSATGAPEPGAIAAYIWMFAALFGLAFLARAGSTTLLALQSEPRPVPTGFRDVALPEFVARFKSDTGGRLLIAMLVMTVGVMVSGPYFSPFMLQKLELDYRLYTLLIGANFLAKSFTLPWAGRIAKRLGPSTLLWIGAIGIVPLPALWAVSNNIWWLIGSQLLTGVLWAFYELATFLMLFETIPASQRIGMLARFQIFNTAAQVLGGLLGFGLLRLLDESLEAYYLVFVASGVLRMAAIPLVARCRVPAFEVTPLPIRPISIQPAGAAVDSPVIGAIADPTPLVPTPPPAAADPASFTAPTTARPSSETEATLADTAPRR